MAGVPKAMTKQHAACFGAKVGAKACACGATSSGVAAQSTARATGRDAFTVPFHTRVGVKPDAVRCRFAETPARRRGWLDGPTTDRR